MGFMAFISIFIEESHETMVNATHRTFFTTAAFRFDGRCRYDLWWHNPLAWDPKAKHDIELAETFGALGCRRNFEV